MTIAFAPLAQLGLTPPDGVIPVQDESAWWQPSGDRSMLGLALQYWSERLGLPANPFYSPVTTEPAAAGPVVQPPWTGAGIPASAGPQSITAPGTPMPAFPAAPASIPAPPMVGAPQLPAVPQLQAPDYSAARAVLEQMNPGEYQGLGEDEQQQLLLSGVLQGLAQGGLGNARNTGELILNMGLGALGGYGVGQENLYSEERQRRTEHEDRFYRFMEQRLALELDEEMAQTDVANRQAELGYDRDLAQAELTADANNRNAALAWEHERAQRDQDNQYVAARWATEMELWREAQPQFMGQSNGRFVFSIRGPEGITIMEIDGLDEYRRLEDVARAVAADPTGSMTPTTGFYAVRALLNETGSMTALAPLFAAEQDEATLFLLRAQYQSLVDSLGSFGGQLPPLTDTMSAENIREALNNGLLALSNNQIIDDSTIQQQIWNNMQNSLAMAVGSWLVRDENRWNNFWHLMFREGQ